MLLIRTVIFVTCTIWKIFRNCLFLLHVPDILFFKINDLFILLI